MGLKSALFHSSCLTLDKSLNLSELQFPHLKEEDGTLTKLFGRLTETIYSCTNVASRALFKPSHLIPHFQSLIGQGFQQVLMLAQSWSFKGKTSTVVPKSICHSAEFRYSLACSMVVCGLSPLWDSAFPVVVELPI